METLLVIIVILLGLLIVLFMGIIVLLVYKIFHGQKVLMKAEIKEDATLYMVEREKVRSTNDDNIGQYCIDHPELLAKGICSLSDNPFCELCIAKENDIRIARKYLSILLDSDWDNIFFIPNEQVGADILNELYRIKHDIWSSLNIPIITQQQFKINIENDNIESFTLVMGRKIDNELITNKLDFLNSINKIN